ncbi:hypothetical protein GCM10010231_44590 [Streptomyces sindenensis]|nr:hypothetical protein GCM10010231_44590 [Streptomyces sindenensis]
MARADQSTAERIRGGAGGRSRAVTPSPVLFLAPGDPAPYCQGLPGPAAGVPAPAGVPGCAVASAGAVVLAASAVVAVAVVLVVSAVAVVLAGAVVPAFSVDAGACGSGRGSGGVPASAGCSGGLDASDG